MAVIPISFVLLQLYSGQTVFLMDTIVCVSNIKSLPSPTFIFFKWFPFFYPIGSSISKYIGSNLYIWKKIQVAIYTYAPSSPSGGCHASNLVQRYPVTTGSSWPTRKSILLLWIWESLFHYLKDVNLHIITLGFLRILAILLSSADLSFPAVLFYWVGFLFMELRPCLAIFD